MLSVPLNLPKWLSENSHLLQPPVNNYCVYNEGFAVMVREDSYVDAELATQVSDKCLKIVGGPNARSDYHINETPEWFYQYSGSMLLKVVDEGTFKDIAIREGEMFLLPPNTPHNPVRFANTVGIVLEQKRPADSVDRLRWYCQECGSMVHESSFHCTDLGTQIKEAVNDFKSSDEKRSCPKCGTLAALVPKNAVQP